MVDRLKIKFITMRITTKKFIGGLVIGLILGIVLGALVMFVGLGNYCVNALI